MKLILSPRVHLISIFLIMSSTQSAYAYLDPGTASLILQGIVGAIGAGMVAISLYWRRFVGIFKNEVPDEASPTDHDGGVREGRLSKSD